MYQVNCSASLPTMTHKVNGSGTYLCTNVRMYIRKQLLILMYAPSELVLLRMYNLIAAFLGSSCKLGITISCHC